MSKTFCKRFTDGTRASFYFTANDNELADLFKTLTDFVKKNDIHKLNLENVDAEIATQHFEEDKSDW
jgi:hypothetical protein